MKNRQKLLILAAALLLLAGGGWFLTSTGFFQAIGSPGTLRAYIDRFAPYSHLLFFLVQFLSVVLAPIPSNITAAAGGLLFGTWPAFLLTFSAVAAGSLLTFSLARALGRDFADRLVSQKLSEKYQGILHSKAPVFLSGRAHQAVLPPFRRDRPGHPALGAAFRQRPGRVHPEAPPLGDGPHRPSRACPVPAGHEVWR